MTVIDDRIKELLKMNPRGRPNDSFNCHGASMYVLGVVPKLKYIDFPEMIKTLSKLKKGFHGLKATQIDWDKNTRGDLVVIGEHDHSGIITTPSSTNPIVFSKHGRLYCARERLKKLVDFYSRYCGANGRASVYRVK